MAFAVLDPNAENIVDPDTQETLGSFHRPKVMVRVSSVQEHMCIAGTYESHRENVGGSGLGGIAGLFQAPRYVTRYKTFKTSDAPEWEQLDEGESYVNVGDPAEEVVGVISEASAPPPTSDV
jgi:hypothetical protein